MTDEAYARTTWYKFSLRCEGYKAKRLKDQQFERALAWSNICLHADPKTIEGMTAEDWLILEGEKQPAKVIPLWKRKDFKNILDKYRNYGGRNIKRGTNS